MSVNGIVVNDSNGLCIKGDGDLVSTMKNGKAGYFSTLTDTSGTLCQELGEDQPTIRLETSTRTLLVSDFMDESHGQRTIAISKPKSSNN